MTQRATEGPDNIDDQPQPMSIEELMSAIEAYDYISRTANWLLVGSPEWRALRIRIAELRR